MTSIFKKSAVILASLLILLPGAGVSACNSCGGGYTYRSTVLGTGVNNKGSDVYEISGERSGFSSSDNVHTLTRIFDIRNVRDFRVKLELQKEGSYYQEWVSPEYRPNGSWWAETYVWHNFGRLSDGSYAARVFINYNGSGWELRDTRNFRVGGTGYGYGYQNTYYPYNYANQNNYPYHNYHNNNNYNWPYSYNNYPGYYYGTAYRNPEYQHGWTKLGTGIRNTNSWYYDIVNERSDFGSNENIYVLTDIKNIHYVDRFRLKFEVYKNGSTRYRTHEGEWFYPRGQLWQDNFNNYQIGKMPEGDHEVRVYIKINNEEYKHLYTKKFAVDNDYYGGDGDYKFSFTNIGTRIEQTGPYEYKLNDSGSTFYEGDYLKALTKLEEIKYADRFQVKHVLYEGNRIVKTIEGNWWYPRYAWWRYNYTISDLGTLSASKYTLKTYIRVNDGSYKLKNNRDFTVKERYDYNYGNYNYYPDYYYGQPQYQQPYNYNYPYGYDDTHYPAGWSDPGGQYHYQY